MQYINALNELRSREYHELKEIKDQWRTPDWVYCALNKLYGPFHLDLFTDGQNSKCERFFTADDNALVQDWAGRLAEIHIDRLGIDTDELYRIQTKAFANPPYSQKRAGDHPLTGMTHIMAKAYEECKKGAYSVFLVKAATAESWWPAETASRIIFIRGRLGFVPPVWFKPKEGESPATTAGFGAAIVIFDPMNLNVDGDIPEHEYISRTTLEHIGMPLANEREEDMRAWIDLWDDI